MARIAGSDITASPSQLVARTMTRDIDDGLKATDSSVAALLCHHKACSKRQCLYWHWPVAISFGLRAETHSLTLRQAVELALKQNPDIVLARLDEEKVRQGSAWRNDPFSPRVTVGSGLAYSDGFPMSIEGSAPSMIQAQANMAIFNRQKSLEVAQAKEDVRGAAFVTANKRDEAAYRAAMLYLDAERAARLSEVGAQGYRQPSARAATPCRRRCRKGARCRWRRNRPSLAIAQARQAALELDDRARYRRNVAGHRARVSRRRPRPTPVSRGTRRAAIAADARGRHCKRLSAPTTSCVNCNRRWPRKQLEIRSDKAARLPRVDLVAQYALLAKFNNYAQFYNTFQRNNGQIGASFQVPIFSGSGIGGQVAQAEIDVTHLRTEMVNVRNRIAADLQQSYREVAKAQSATEVARLDLDVAREQISVDLAQMQEGRLAMRQLEEARVAENAKWIALYDTQYAAGKSALERAAAHRPTGVRRYDTISVAATGMLKIAAPLKALLESI